MMGWEFIKYGDPMKGAENGIEEVNLLKLIRITATAKSLAPVDTARLKNSIQYKTSEQSGCGEGVLNVFPKKGEGYVGSNVKYAIYLEFGTRKMKPQPFLRPAIALEGFGKDVNEVIAKMNKEMESALTKGKKIQKFF